MPPTGVHSPPDWLTGVSVPPNRLRSADIPAAMSFVWPMRPSGMSATLSWAMLGLSWWARVMGESTSPGWTELARMFSEAYWMVVDLLKISTAPLEAL